MVGKPISLSKRRKARDRADRKTAADANAARFGRSKAEKDIERRKSDQAAARLDGHKRDHDGEG